MIKKISFIVGLVSIFSISGVFAIATPTNFTASETTDTTVTFNWDSVSGAAAYVLYYGTDSENLVEYDLAESAPYTVVGLTKDTTYFAAISTNDDNFDESPRSDEISFITGESQSSGGFALENVEVLSDTKLQLTFNADLDESEWALREFKITNKFDELEQLDVLSAEIDEEEKNILVLTMTAPMPVSVEYNVVVVKLNDSEGNNIQNGVDGLAGFITPDSYETQIEDIEETPDELDSAGPSEPQLEVSGGSSGQNLSDDQLAKTTATTAESAENLPTTGTEHWFIWILALLLWAVLLKFRTYKQS